MSASDTSPPVKPGLVELFTQFLIIGAISFGGGIVAYERSLLVEQKKWVDADSFMAALALSQTLPGLNSVNLAAIVGQRLAGLPGALACTIGLIIPGAVVVLALGILYESYIHPLTILSTLPSAGVGALLALYATGGEFSLISLLGLFLLIGVVKKNAILMIDLALQLERHQGFTPEESIRQACLLRLRPILMTTLAAILGALPLLLSRAEGAEMRQPLGLTIIGGLVVSQVLTLYTTPVVYLYLDRLRHRFNRWRGVRTDAALETPL